MFVWSKRLNFVGGIMFDNDEMYFWLVFVCLWLDFVSELNDCIDIGLVVYFIYEYISILIVWRGVWCEVVGVNFVVDFV